MENLAQAQSRLVVTARIGKRWRKNKVLGEQGDYRASKGPAALLSWGSKVYTQNSTRREWGPNYIRQHNIYTFNNT